MQIPATAQPQVYLPKAQARFDAAAERVTAAAATAASDEPDSDADAGRLTSSLVGMKAESLVNSLLYGVARKQSEMQQSQADLIKPR